MRPALHLSPEMKKRCPLSLLRKKKDGFSAIPKAEKGHSAKGYDEDIKDGEEALR